MLAVTSSPRRRASLQGRVEQLHALGTVLDADDPVCERPDCAQLLAAAFAKGGQRDRIGVLQRVEPSLGRQVGRNPVLTLQLMPDQQRIDQQLSGGRVRVSLGTEDLDGALELRSGSRSTRSGRDRMRAPVR